MNQDPRFITILFSNIKDTDKLVNKFETHIKWPIVGKKVQNNGIAVFVIEGFDYGDIESYMRDFLTAFGLGNVRVAASKGNVFS